MGTPLYQTRAEELRDPKRARAFLLALHAQGLEIEFNRQLLNGEGQAGLSDATVVGLAEIALREYQILFMPPVGGTQ